jgi:hypothetical protein
MYRLIYGALYYTITAKSSAYPLYPSYYVGQNLAAWNELIPHIANIVQCHERDEFQWNLHPNGKFSVKSHYLAMIHTDVPNLNKDLWKLKVSLKIEIFMWYL